MKVNLLKNDVKVSFAYRLPFLTPVEYGLGEASIGITAGSGIEGAGEAERRIAGEDPNEDLRLWLTALGGFIGSAIVVGVPGAEGAGDPVSTADSVTEL